MNDLNELYLKKEDGSPIKILQINVEWDQGGPGGVEKDIFNNILTYGGDGYIAYSRGKVPNDKQFIKIGWKIDTYIHALSSRFFDNSGLMSKISTILFIKKINKLKPDIIHLHSLLGYYINYKLLFEYLKHSNIPVVWTMHDCWAFTGHCINFERVKCEKWKMLCNHCVLKKDYPTSYFKDSSKNNYILKKNIFTSLNRLYLITPSKWLKEIMANSFFKNNNIEVIYNGIDFTDFKPTESNYIEEFSLNGKKLLVAAAYMWGEMKGAKLIEEIADLLDDSYRIIMIGNKEHKPVSHKIVDIPFTSNKKELAQWYTIGDVYINPTFGDNFPTVNIEALACGCPVVTNNTGGSAEAAGNIAGRVVYSKTATEFVEKIKECINEHYTSDFCISISNNFKAEIALKRYIELYKTITCSK